MNVLTKIKKAKNDCLNEWFENYNYQGNNETLRACRHNRVLPKIALVGVVVLLILTLIAIV